MLSLIELEKKVQDLQSQIALIKDGSFRSGEAPNYDGEDITYPLLGFRYVSSSVNSRIVTDVLNLYFADRVHKDRSNETEVVSNMKRSALRVFSELKYDVETNHQATVTASQITPFVERWGDEVSGVEVNITIEQFFDNSTCD